MGDYLVTSGDGRTWRVTGLYATYRGREYRTVSYSSGRSRGVAILEIGDHDNEGFEGIRSERSHGGPVARVSLRLLDSLIRVDLRARFAGREVLVMATDGSSVELFANGPDVWARPNGLIGSWRDGWSGNVPLGDVEILGEDVHDLLHDGRRAASSS